MGKMHTLVGEEFFRGMLRLENERKRLHGRNDDASRVRSPNVVSLEDYRRRHIERSTLLFVPPKTSA